MKLIEHTLAHRIFFPLGIRGINCTHKPTGTMDWLDQLSCCQRRPGDVAKLSYSRPVSSRSVALTSSPSIKHQADHRGSAGDVASAVQFNTVECVECVAPSSPPGPIAVSGRSKSWSPPDPKQLERYTSAPKSQVLAPPRDLSWWTRAPSRIRSPVAHRPASAPCQRAKLPKLVRPTTKHDRLKGSDLPQQRRSATGRRSITRRVLALLSAEASRRSYIPETSRSHTRDVSFTYPRRLVLTSAETLGRREAPGGRDGAC